MKVTYFHQHFKINSGGTRSYEFSKYLVKQGHQVTMITGNGNQNILKDGIKVKSTKTKYSQNFSFIRRILSFVHFMIVSTFIGLKEKGTDVIYATSTPLTIGVPALIVSKLKRKSYIFEVRDVWPDVPIELGVIKSKLLQKILFKFESIIYKNAAHIVVLSEGMKENLHKKKSVPLNKITVITNLSMNNHFDKLETNERIENKDKLVCIHPGTMGIVNGLDFILDVAEQFPNDDIIYLLIGEGNQKNNLIKKVKRNNIKNVIIKDGLPKDEVIKEIKKSDVGIMIVDDYEILQDNSANKFFDYLAAGLPVVINYGGWQKAVLEENKAGKGFMFDDKEGFYNLLLEFKKNMSLLKEYSRNAKHLAETEYDSQILARRFERVLLTVKQHSSK